MTEPTQEQIDRYAPMGQRGKPWSELSDGAKRRVLKFIDMHGAE